MYMAPESLMDKIFDEKTDIYSFGLVLWEILTRKEDAKDGNPRGVLFPSFAERNQPGMTPCAIQELISDFVDEISDGLRPQIPDGFPQNLTLLLEKTWDTFPSQRPSCLTIIDCLDEQRLNVAIPLKNASRFWSKHFGRQDSVFWSKFRKQFCSSFNVTFNPEDDGRPIQGKTRVSNFADLPPSVQCLRCLHALLSSKPVCFQTALPDFVLTMERFGSVTQWLGGWTTNYLLEALSLCTQCFDQVKQRWFFGDISQQQATCLLREKKRGTFLIYFSEKPGEYIVSYVSSNEKICHTRILPHFDGNGCRTCFEVNGQFYTSLQDIVDHFSILDRSCPDSPYQNIVELDSNQGFSTQIIED